MATPKFLKSLLAHPVVHNTAAPFLRKPGTRVLMYHRISGPDAVFKGLDIDIFRQHVAWLAKHYTPIRVQDLDDPSLNRRSARPAVLLTFDDGYTDFYENAYPILREFDVPALVFIPTEA
ncbi:MAG: polysaccharide deacetylase family protein, partial [Pseudomonadota bacterium]